jgi:hypothetical protein
MYSSPRVTSDRAVVVRFVGGCSPETVPGVAAIHSFAKMSGESAPLSRLFVPSPVQSCAHLFRGHDRMMYSYFDMHAEQAAELRRVWRQRGGSAAKALRFLALGLAHTLRAPCAPPVSSLVLTHFRFFSHPLFTHTIQGACCPNHRSVAVGQGVAGCCRRGQSTGFLLVPRSKAVGPSSDSTATQRKACHSIPNCPRSLRTVKLSAQRCGSPLLRWVWPPNCQQTGRIWADMPPTGMISRAAAPCCSSRLCQFIQ